MAINRRSNNNHPMPQNSCCFDFLDQMLNSWQKDTENLNLILNVMMETGLNGNRVEGI